MPSKLTTPQVSEEALRTRAYLMWEADGKPFGRDEHYWGLATAETIAEPSKPKRAAAKNAVPEKRAKANAATKPKGKAPVAKAKRK